MTVRIACAALIARSTESWQVLLQQTTPDLVATTEVTPWALPNTELGQTQSPDAVLAKHIHKETGQRIMPTELLPLGWFHTSATAGQEQQASALVSILPSTDTGGTLAPNLRWWSLRAAVADHTAPSVTPFHWRILCDAAHLAPRDNTLAPVVSPAEPRHESSLLSLLHSVRERTGGIIPGVWDNDLSNLEFSHRSTGGDFLVAALQDFVVGMIGIRPLGGNVAELTWIMVHPRWRYLGLGSELISAAEERAQYLGFNILGVTSHHLHGSGRHVFRKAGFDRPSSGHFGQEYGFAATKHLDGGNPSRKPTAKPDVHQPFEPQQPQPSSPQHP